MKQSLFLAIHQSLSVVHFYEADFVLEKSSKYLVVSLSLIEINNLYSSQD